MFWSPFSAPRPIDRVYLSESESVGIDDFVAGYLRARPEPKRMSEDDVSQWERVA